MQIRKGKGKYKDIEYLFWITDIFKLRHHFTRYKGVQEGENICIDPYLKVSNLIKR